MPRTIAIGDIHDCSVALAKRSWNLAPRPLVQLDALPAGRLPDHDGIG